MSNNLTQEELLEAQIISDPVFFAEVYLRSPSNPKEELILRPYQKGILRDRHQRRVLRMGRRTGKSVSLAVEAIWKAFTNAHREVLLVAGYDSQVGTLFNLMNRMVKDSPEVRKSISNTRMRPYEIHFKNGSIIMGYVGNNSVRGKCLPGYTQIIMSDGESKPAKEIKVGDKVLSYDIIKNEKEKSKGVQIGEVTNIFDNGVKDIYELETSSQRFLHSTDNHKIMCLYGGWTELKDIKTQEHYDWQADYVAVIHPDGRTYWSRAKRIKRIGTAKTYDFTVEDNHNFIAFNPAEDRMSGFNINKINSGGILVHNSADDVYIDEIDSIPNDYLLEAVIPISTTHKHTSITISGTPSGRREYFYNISKNKDLPAFDFKEHHIPSMESPEWTPQQEEFQRSITTKSQFDREYNAEFGSAAEGVFKNKFIDNNLYVYDYKDLKYDKDNHYILGVDWNESMFGVQAVVLEYVQKPTLLLPYNDGKFKNEHGKFIDEIEHNNFLRVYFADNIDAEDYTNIGAVQFIIELMKKIDFTFCAFDKGHGEANYEMLRLTLDKGKYVGTNGDIILADKMRYMLDRTMSVDMGGSFDILDPITKQAKKALTKNVMVKNAQMLNENGNLVIPAMSKTGKVMEDDDNRLVGQMRNYIVERIGKTGEIYGSSAGEDHRLDAFMLGIHAFMVNHSIFHKKEAEFAIDEVNDGIMAKIAPGWRSDLESKQNLQPTISKVGDMTVRNYGNWSGPGEPPETEWEDSPRLKLFKSPKFKHKRRSKTNYKPNRKMK